MRNLKKIRKYTEKLGFKRGCDEEGVIVYYYRYEDMMDGLCRVYVFKGMMDYVGIPFKCFLSNNDIRLKF